MNGRELRPDALIIGAPKAGTSALHAALARHPGVYASPIKEPKFYLCGEGSAAGVPGSGGCPSSAGMGLAAAVTSEQLFAHAPGNLGPRDREHAVLPLRRATPVAGSPEELPDAKFIVIRPRARSIGRTPTGCICGSTGSSRSQRLRRGLVIGSGSGIGGRMGAILALQADGTLRAAGSADLFSRVDRVSGSW